MTVRSTLGPRTGRTAAVLTMYGDTPPSPYPPASRRDRQCYTLISSESDNDKNILVHNQNAN